VTVLHPKSPHQLDEAKSFHASEGYEIPHETVVVWNYVQPGIVSCGTGTVKVNSEKVAGTDNDLPPRHIVSKVDADDRVVSMTDAVSNDLSSKVVYVGVVVVDVVVDVESVAVPAVVVVWCRSS
jgi:hypothetical protein